MKRSIDNRQNGSQKIHYIKSNNSNNETGKEINIEKSKKQSDKTNKNDKEMVI